MLSSQRRHFKMKMWMTEPKGHKQHDSPSTNTQHSNELVKQTCDVFGGGAYQLQPGIGDQHLVLLILEESKRERA